MNEARAAPGPVPPGAGAGPDAFGIDEDLESALLAGLAEAPEAFEGPASRAGSDAVAPARGTAGVRLPPSDPGTSRAAVPAPPTDQAEPRAEIRRRNGLDLPHPAPDALSNATLVRSPNPEAAPNGAQLWLTSPDAAPGAAGPELSPLPSGPRDAHPVGGESKGEGPDEPAPANGADGGRAPFAIETGTGSALRSERTLDEAPAKRSLVPIATRDEPARRTGSEGPPNERPAALPRDWNEPKSGENSALPQDGLPAGSARGAPAGDGSEPGFGFEARFDPGPRDEEPAGYLPAPGTAWSAPAIADDPDLERALRDGLSEGPAGDLPPFPVPGEPAASAPGGGPDPGSASRHGPGNLPPFPPPEVLAFDEEPPLAPSVAPDPPPDKSHFRPPDRSEPPPDPSLAPDPVPHAGIADGLAEEPAGSPTGVDLDAGTPSLGDIPAVPADGGEVAVLAFATDPESESALREGLSEHPNPQVWPGGLRTAIATLGAGESSPLLFVDLDETAYPAGAIHDLAAVCEIGTVVIAFGSDATARFSREALLAGVSDYLVKPLTAAAVREAAARAAAATRAGAADDPAGGWSVGFAGTGGSGATTLAAAAAILAAERGRYVSVLDLSRTFSALSFLLDVEPAPGLVDLLSTVARASLHPDVVDGMRAARSDRITVYGYSWSATPPPVPPEWAVCELLTELQRRSHLVIVDGLDDPATRIALLAIVDARVLVVEPTVTGAAAAARALDHLGPMADAGLPLLLVQNHTRPLKPRTGAGILRDAGVEASPEVVVPFEPDLPAHSDRGWPEGRLPRPLRKPLAALADRILAAPAAVPALA